MELTKTAYLVPVASTTPGTRILFKGQCGEIQNCGNSDFTVVLFKDETVASLEACWYNGKIGNFGEVLEPDKLLPRCDKNCTHEVTITRDTVFQKCQAHGSQVCGLNNEMPFYFLVFSK